MGTYMESSRLFQCELPCACYRCVQFDLSRFLPRLGRGARDLQWRHRFNFDSAASYTDPSLSFPDTWIAFGNPGSSICNANTSALSNTDTYTNLDGRDRHRRHPAC